MSDLVCRKWNTEIYFSNTTLPWSCILMILNGRKTKLGRSGFLYFSELFKEMCDFRELETSSFPWNSSGHREDWESFRLCSQVFFLVSTGRLVASLVAEFLQFFNLDFTLAVFHPETSTVRKVILHLSYEISVEGILSWKSVSLTLHGCLHLDYFFVFVRLFYCFSRSHLSCFV